MSVVADVAVKIGWGRTGALVASGGLEGVSVRGTIVEALATGVSSGVATTFSLEMSTNVGDGFRVAVGMVLEPTQLTKAPVSSRTNTVFAMHPDEVMRPYLQLRDDFRPLD